MFLHSGCMLLQTPQSPCAGLSYLKVLGENFPLLACGGQIYFTDITALFGLPFPFFFVSFWGKEGVLGLFQCSLASRGTYKNTHNSSQAGVTDAHQMVASTLVYFHRFPSLSALFFEVPCSEKHPLCYHSLLSQITAL